METAIKVQVHQRPISHELLRQAMLAQRYEAAPRVEIKIRDLPIDYTQLAELDAVHLPYCTISMLGKPLVFKVSSGG